MPQPEAHDRADSFLFPLQIRAPTPVRPASCSWVRPWVLRSRRISAPRLLPVGIVCIVHPYRDDFGGFELIAPEKQPIGTFLAWSMVNLG